MEQGPEPEESPEAPDSDSQEEEPRLKYQRVGLSVSGILRRDSASAVAVCAGFLVLGTHTGAVYVVELTGQELTSWHAHSATVNDISIDRSNQIVATCADDGLVHIRAVDGRTAPATFSYARPVLGLALDPDYSKAGRFASGGRSGELVLKEKGWLGSKDVVLQKGEGPIYAVSWHGTLIAWANSRGVKLYDAATAQRISHIERAVGSGDPELHRCVLCWEDPVTLTIGWGNSIQVGKIGRASSWSQQRYAEIVQAYQTDFFVCGLAVWGEGLLVLAHLHGTEANPLSEPPEQPEIRLLSRLDDSRFEIEAYDVLSLRGWQLHPAADFMLCDLSEHDPADGARLRPHPLFFVGSPNDIVLGKPRDWDDHIGWLVEQGELEAALEAALDKERRLQWVSVPQLGKKLLGELVSQQQFAKAASWLPRLLGEKDAEQWGDWVFVFAQHRQLDQLIELIPVGKPRLDVVVYEMVLGFVLQAGQLERFRQLVALWGSPADHQRPLFGPSSLIAPVQQRLERSAGEERLVLQESLAELYLVGRQYVQALHILLQLGKPEVWGLIAEHGLFGQVQDKVQMLLEFDEQKAIGLLTEHTDDIPVASVVQQLQASPQLQLKYLHQLFLLDQTKGAAFDQLLVSLYAKYGQSERLGPLLESSSSYELESALATCQEGGLQREQVLILEKMGRCVEALELLMNELQDIDAAIALVQRQDGQQQDSQRLWAQFFELCARTPESIARALDLLADGSLSADPIRMVQSIPKGSLIEQATTRLHRIVMAHKQNGSIQHRFNKLLESDAGKLSHTHHTRQKRPVGRPASRR